MLFTKASETGQHLAAARAASLINRETLSFKISCSTISKSDSPSIPALLLDGAP